MTKPNLKYIVHRYYAVLYVFVAIIIGGVVFQQSPQFPLRLVGSIALLVLVVLAHLFQIASITPIVIAEHSDEE